MTLVAMTLLLKVNMRLYLYLSHGLHLELQTVTVMATDVIGI